MILYCIGRSTTLVSLLFLSCINVGIGVFTDFDMVRPWAGAWGSKGHTPFIKIDSINNNGPNVSSNANFGFSVANIGDLNDDGVDEIAVGAIGETLLTGNSSKPKLLADVGGIYILFMNKNGSVTSSVRIGSLENGGPPLIAGDQFGYSIAALGDMDGDRIPDIAVGAPGILLASVYILYMDRNGSARNYTLIRGKYDGASPNTNQTIPVNQTSTPTYIANGPPVRYGSRFGTAVSVLSDLNKDGVNEIAVSGLDISGGRSRVYILYMQSNGKVLNYTVISPGGIGGGPEISNSFTGFGSSLLKMPDFDGDNVSELVIGAKDLYDPGSQHIHAGKSFFCFLARNGTAKRCETFGEYSLGATHPIPNVAEDECGSSLAYIGDINRDNYRQRKWYLLAKPARPSIPDFIMGCPQSGTGNMPGRFFLMFLSAAATLRGFTEIPAETDLAGQGGGRHTGPRVAPVLHRVDSFGQSLSGYQDIDHNGLREIIVGAPGDDHNFTSTNAGSIYIIFLRRRRHHYIPFDFLSYILTITIPLFCCCCSTVSGIVYFFWYFRRKPDEVEIIVKKSGYEMAKERKRYQKSNNQVYVDNYTV